MKRPGSPKKEECKYIANRELEDGLEAKFLEIPTTPINEEDEAKQSPVDFGERGEEAKEGIYYNNKEYKETKFDGFAKAFAAATTIQLQNDLAEEPRKKHRIRGLSKEVTKSLARSIGYLFEVQRKEYSILKSAQRAFFSMTTMHKTLILDLDNTLINAFSGEKEENSNFLDEYTPTTKLHKIPYIRRPGLSKFLKEMDKIYEIWIYSAAETSYVLDMLSSIDPRHEYFRGALTRENCAILSLKENGGIAMKNLSVITNRELRNMIIVDDLIHVWPNNLSNLIPIEPFYGNPQDRALEPLQKLLIKLHKSSDVRKRIQERIPLVHYTKTSFTEMQM